MDDQARLKSDISNLVYFRNQSNPILSKSLKRTRAGISMKAIMTEEKKRNKTDYEAKAEQLRKEMLLNKAAAKDANL